MPSRWRRLCSTFELSLDLTFNSGQTFQWRFHDRGQNPFWYGIIGESPIALTQVTQDVHYYTASQGHDENALNMKIRKYFRLETDLSELVKEWKLKDVAFPEAQGLRLLNQDSMETLFQYLCSSNNNVSRIKQMYQRLLSDFGTEIIFSVPPLNVNLCDDLNGHENQDQSPCHTTTDQLVNVKVHSFPQLKCLATPEAELKLRQAGFGYRAKFVRDSAKKLLDMGLESSGDVCNFIESQIEPISSDDSTFDSTDSETDTATKKFIQRASYAIKVNDQRLIATTTFLTTLPGIGCKVASCIALSGFDLVQAIPVDVHVHRIATRDLGFKSRTKSLTKGTYDEIGRVFVEAYGKWAGWAQLYLFYRELISQPGRKRKKGKVDEEMENKGGKRIKRSRTM